MTVEAKTTYDVAVVGGGAAGLSAALVLGRARRRVVVVDAGSPRNAPAAHMQGFLSRDGMSPATSLLRDGPRSPATAWSCSSVRPQTAHGVPSSGRSSL
jgi:thioredoxin reductase